MVLIEPALKQMMQSLNFAAKNSLFLQAFCRQSCCEHLQLITTQNEKGLHKRAGTSETFRHAKFRHLLKKHRSCYNKTV
jgi:hypothetical protein